MKDNIELTFSIMYVSAAAWSRWKLEVVQNRHLKQGKWYTLCDEQDIDGTPVQVIYEWEARNSAICWVHASIADDCSATVL